ncbi:hypothetical protein L226DRAFT_490531 [Lentinus tigrinus ALCF2SS1-7]|uniref:Uncharacterized protein n=1 Tax=Lentinus tigrinus ALCF2SS1-6 TaxID=1328759 RepID=A0A5C2S9N4_9APHY|nr:hypothetical protein L227DRAFT_655052 [Lentinus tigrinus ALCF2SS1-6]RPD72263.1 hypothetical protein L226DRAFT_490531 [Lentinus tigrinus ALCF2SS1-7]
MTVSLQGEDNAGAKPPMGTGPPTHAELVAYYPGKLTWSQIQAFINAGMLDVIHRDPVLHQRYMAWSAKTKDEYGSMIAYLKEKRLQWGKPDTLSRLGTSHTDPAFWTNSEDTPPRTLEYFTAQTPSEYFCVVSNDWPYSIPADVEHVVVWTKLPIIHPSLVDARITEIVGQIGLTGCTGLDSPPPSLADELPGALPALTAWKITAEDVKSMPNAERLSPEERELMRRAGKEVDEFIRKRWREDEWETCWFVNPPRRQTVPGLAHAHVFARRKGHRK